MAEEKDVFMNFTLEVQWLLCSTTSININELCITPRQCTYLFIFIKYISQQMQLIKYKLRQALSSNMQESNTCHELYFIEWVCWVMY
jgi:hypothetical protein